MAADSAVMVIDASKGVEAQTKKLFKVCVMRHIPIFTFINKMDRDANDTFDLLDEIELEVLRNQLSSYADIELLFENPEDFGLSWETVSWGEINLTDDEDIAFINNILEQLYSIDYESLDEQDRIFAADCKTF